MEKPNFQILPPTEKYIMIKLTGHLAPESVAAFNEAMPSIIPAQPLDIILNCEQLLDITSAWLRALIQIQKNLKASNKQLRLVSASPAITKFLKNEGVDSSLKSCVNLQSALVDLGLAPAPSTIDVNFISPFISATAKVLETQASTKVKIGTPFKKLATDKFAGEISGVIGLVSDSFNGSVVISFPGPTFLKIMSRMLGEECTTINKEIQDGAGEITNIIFGQAKITLNEKGFGIKTALPSVVAGQDHAKLLATVGSRMVVPIETDVGAFCIEISVSPQNSHQKAS